jgi:hypothetical protein
LEIFLFKIDELHTTTSANLMDFEGSVCSLFAGSFDIMDVLIISYATHCFMAKSTDIILN